MTLLIIFTVLSVGIVVAVVVKMVSSEKMHTWSPPGPPSPERDEAHSRLKLLLQLRDMLGRASPGSPEEERVLASLDRLEPSYSELKTMAQEKGYPHERKADIAKLFQSRLLAATDRDVETHLQPK